MAITTVITGRMTADPEVKIVKVDGVEAKVINFYLACDDVSSKDKDGKPEVEFFRITAWRGAAEAFGKYGRKGRTITATGASHLRNYTRNNMTRHYMAIERPWYFEFLDKNGVTEDVVKNDIPDGAVELPVTDDELPFDLNP